MRWLVSGIVKSYESFGVQTISAYESARNEVSHPDVRISEISEEQFARFEACSDKALRNKKIVTIANWSMKVILGSWVTISSLPLAEVLASINECTTNASDDVNCGFNFEESYSRALVKGVILTGLLALQGVSENLNGCYSRFDVDTDLQIRANIQEARRRKKIQ